MLPAAAGWIEGEATASIAESTPERISLAGERTWDLALQLLRVVDSSEAASIVASPASMVTSLGLAYGRYENGQCGDRIAEVMDFSELGDDLHQTIGATIGALESRAIPGREGVDPLVLSMRQSTWAFDTEMLPEPTGLAELYGAKPNALEDRGEAARELINCIIEVESDGLLPDFLPEGQPASDTTSYDVNVTVLKSPWLVGMTPQSVEFNYANGTAGAVDGFGSDNTTAGLYETEAFTAVDLPLRGAAISVMVVMPPADYTDGLDTFATELAADDLRAARDEAVYSPIGLTMPNVAIDSGTLDYNERLGFECEPFTLRAVLHGATLELDAKGIKAAAATVSEGFEDDGGGASDYVDVDRPFLFFVHDSETDFVLYSGRYSPE